MEDISARTKDYLDTYLLGELTGNASIICIQMQNQQTKTCKVHERRRKAHCPFTVQHRGQSEAPRSRNRYITSVRDGDRLRSSANMATQLLQLADNATAR